MPCYRIATVSKTVDATVVLAEIERSIAPRTAELYPELRLGAGYGEIFQTPSRFLREIPEELLEVWDVSPSPSAKWGGDPLPIDDEPF